MPSRRKIIGLTGPSSFTNECMDVIEDFLDVNLVLLFHRKNENVEEWLEQSAGVIVSGGLDIHPSIYSDSIYNNANLSKFDLARDLRELAIIEYCIKHRKPMLCICRGHQLLGVRYNMGLIADISCSDYCHAPSKTNNIVLGKGEPCHSISFVDGKVRNMFYDKYKMPSPPPERKLLDSILADRETNKDKLWVNSFHHQAIPFNSVKKYEEEGITVIGIAKIGLQSYKDIIEFMHGPSWISVQWHPEYDYELNSPSRVVLARFKQMIGETNEKM